MIVVLTGMIDVRSPGMGRGGGAGQGRAGGEGNGAGGQGGGGRMAQQVAERKGPQGGVTQIKYAFMHDCFYAYKFMRWCEVYWYK